MASVLTLVMPSVIADDVSVAVLYPEVRAPYNRIFEDIIKGIRQSNNGEVNILPLNKEQLETVPEWLDNANPDVVIALGSRGLKLADELSSKFKTVVGATLISDETYSKGYSGISLNPSPALLLKKLKSLTPTVTTVWVVYHPETNQWQVEQAKKYAPKLGLTIKPLPSENVREAAVNYREIFNHNARKKEAVWLLQNDPSLDERGMVPAILNQAWEKNHVVFSSNPMHVRRGALFSLFPDNVHMGESLLKKAHHTLYSKALNIDALEDLDVAVNTRTAEHLGIKLNRARMRDIDLVFPAE